MGVTILLNNPMLMGFKIKRNEILLPFVKPGFGPMLIELNSNSGDFETPRKEPGSQKNIPDSLNPYQLSRSIFPEYLIE
jgi:hypothetical protein